MYTCRLLSIKDMHALKNCHHGDIDIAIHLYSLSFYMVCLPGVQQTALQHSPGIVYCHLQVRDHFSRSFAPYSFLGLFFVCIWDRRPIHSQSLGSKMHETCLIMFGLAESALTLRLIFSSQGSRSRLCERISASTLCL